MFSFIKKLFKPSLLEASKKGDIEAVKQHLAAGADVNAWDDWNVTPLHHAAREGHKEIAELLIAKGADVYAKSEGGSTPLHNAAHQGHKEVAELLIAKGADVNAMDDRGGTPLDYADGETVDLLRKYGGKHGTIHGAAGGGDVEAVKEFLAAGVDVKAKDEDGETPLDWAILLKQTETADLIRKHGGKTAKELKAEGK